jgi:hypothetical protein
LLEDDGSGHDNIDKDEDWMVEKKNNAMNWLLSLNYFRYFYGLGISFKK